MHATNGLRAVGCILAKIYGFMTEIIFALTLPQSISSIVGTLHRLNF